MVPWQVATGLTAAAGGVAAIVLLERLDYLEGYWRLILSEHGAGIAAPAATALASLFAAIHWAARKGGPGRPGPQGRAPRPRPARRHGRARQRTGRGPAEGPRRAVGPWRPGLVTATAPLLPSRASWRARRGSGRGFGPETPWRASKREKRRFWPQPANLLRPQRPLTASARCRAGPGYRRIPSAAAAGISARAPAA